ncbi:MAG TPA: hypothetical protein VGT02_07725 [Methylomirabilota bacterium]|nr:hypothetical protein [Methylomirabilota bacterium]
MILALLAVAWLVLVPGVAAAAGPVVPPPGGYERLAAIVHVHTDLSTGQFSLDELTLMAERQGLGAVLLSENFLNRVEYGLPPFRALTRVSEESPSVRERLDEYLARVAAARTVRPRVLVIPGVEVMPHYFWTGSPWSLSMTLHGTQKNLLVWGLDRAALEGLPVIGNEPAGALGLQVALDVVPALLLVPGLLLLARPRTRRRRLGQAVVIVRRRPWLPGLALCAVGVVALMRAWPFREPVYPPWRDAGSAPFQDVIDYVEQRGGVTVWSLPEARDAGERAVGPVRVSWETEPYPDDLLKTFRYTAFGAIYEDTTRVERPGEGWDRLLGDYAAGQRTRVPWALGEAAFHEHSAGKRVGLIQTVFLVRERSEAGVLDALRAGRMYALQRGREGALALADFTAAADGAAAIAGETLRPAVGAALAVTVRVESGEPRMTDVRVTLVRNGVVTAAWSGPTPLSATHREVWDGTPAVFRLEARAGGTRLLSNPIFVRAAP